MIDTIAITFDKDQFEILNPDRFSPSARMLNVHPEKIGRNGCIRCFQNPTKEDLAKGIYRPRFTLTKRLARGGYTENLRAEFSLPKLLFGNNFGEDGLKNTTGHSAIFANEALETGIKILPLQVTSARLSSVHYSKNFIFTDYTTSSMILRQLSRLNLNSRLDLNKTDYRNGGHALRYHANSYEIVFYDKIKDLEQSRISERRAIESENSIQIDLLHHLPKSFEVLRMEVRLGKRTKIAHIFRKLGIGLPIRFDGIFKKDTSQKILLHFWDQAASDLDLMQMAQMRPEDVFLAIQKYGRVKTGRALQLTGAFTLNQSVGMRGLRAMVENGKAGSWSRLRKGLESLPKVGTEKLNTIKQIKNSLVDFYPLKLQDFGVMP